MIQCYSMFVKTAPSPSNEVNCQGTNKKIDHINGNSHLFTVFLVKMIPEYNLMFCDFKLFGLLNNPFL